MCTKSLEALANPLTYYAITEIAELEQQQKEIKP